ncbi:MULTISPECIES: hypothetical protein [unclassified Streptomyces]|uniref:hypothetical protein n=1 Tax=unclassified Streptomyces TaxID=2593676 RepID=UPI00136D1A0C|nr:MULTISPECIES: hypothetical protein [unclassified Streptomyces]MCW5251108.1 hypothetical protein [Streptomyces sp. SHP 1-2]MYU23130.1 hypothetical protein [Streptomyces sp. SID8352]
MTDDKTPPQRRGGPGGRRVLPPPGRTVDEEWIGRSGGPEHDGSPVRSRHGRAEQPLG